MSQVVVGVVALVAAVVLTLSPHAAAPVAGVVLALTATCAALGHPARNPHDKGPIDDR